MSDSKIQELVTAIFQLEREEVPLKESLKSIKQKKKPLEKELSDLMETLAPAKTEPTCATPAPVKKSKKSAKKGEPLGLSD